LQALQNRLKSDAPFVLNLRGFAIFVAAQRRQGWGGVKQVHDEIKHFLLAQRLHRE
jgi:hypothetical protein